MVRVALFRRAACCVHCVREAAYYQATSPVCDPHTGPQMILWELVLEPLGFKGIARQSRPPETKQYEALQSEICGLGFTSP